MIFVPHRDRVKLRASKSEAIVPNRDFPSDLNMEKMKL